MLKEGYILPFPFLTLVSCSHIDGKARTVFYNTTTTLCYGEKSFSLAHNLRQIKELGWDLLTFDPDLIQGKISNCHLSFDIVKSLKKKFSQNFQ